MGCLAQRDLLRYAANPPGRCRRSGRRACPETSRERTHRLLSMPPRGLGALRVISSHCFLPNLSRPPPLRTSAPLPPPPLVPSRDRIASPAPMLAWEADIFDLAQMGGVGNVTRPSPTSERLSRRLKSHDNRLRRQIDWPLRRRPLLLRHTQQRTGPHGDPEGADRPVDRRRRRFPSRAGIAADRCASSLQGCAGC